MQLCWHPVATVAEADDHDHANGRSQCQDHRQADEKRMDPRSTGVVLELAGAEGRRRDAEREEAQDDPGDVLSLRSSVSHPIILAAPVSAGSFAVLRRAPPGGVLPERPAGHTESAEPATSGFARRTCTAFASRI